MDAVTRQIEDVPEREPLGTTVDLLREGREEILRNWLERVRDNRTVQSGRTLSEPILLDHVPQLFDSMLDRLERNHPREEAEQLAAIHGFSRRLTGYDVVETVVELCMLRRAIWAQLADGDGPAAGVALAMERVDGMVDRAVITSLQAFLDPSARMLVRHTIEVLGSISEADLRAALEDADDRNRSS
jgi:hypothetical protein